ncbi:MAG: hypothetical protein ACLP1E_06400 [Acidimicrobiales bacterium]
MTVMSYCGAMYFGLNGCRTTVPGIEDLPPMITESLDELLAVVRSGYESASRALGPSGGPTESDEAGAPDDGENPPEAW